MAVSRQGIALAAALAAPAALALVVRGAHPFVALGCWTFTVGVAFYGAGTLLERIFSGSSTNAEPSRLLRVGFGMAFYEWTVGCLSAVHRGGRPLVFGVLLAGVAIALWDAATASWSLAARLTRARRWFVARPMVSGVIVLALAFAAVRTALSVRTRSDGFLYDDGEAYTVFVRQLVETGDFDQPFCLRRVQSFGGMTALVSTVFADGGDEFSHAYVFDWGLTFALTVAFAFGVRTSSRVGAWVRAAAIALVALVPHARTNLTCQYAAVFAGLVLARSLEALDGRTKLGQRIPVGLLAAGLAALRQNLLPWAAIMLLVHHGFGWLRAPADRAQRARTLVLDGALTVVFLVPWMVQSWRTFGTPLFPLIRGDVGREGASFIGASVPMFRHVGTAIGVLTYSTPFALIGTLLLAACFLGRRTRESSVLAIAALGTFAAQVYALPTTDLYSQARYAFSWSMAAGLGIVMASGSANRSDRRWVQGAALAAVLVTLVSARDSITRPTLDDLRWEYHAPLAVRQGGDDGPRNARYAAAQAMVPAGARIFTMAEEAYRMDFRRNPIVVLDFPGALGSPPFPARQGAAAIRAYLKSQGFRWLLFEHPLVAEGMFSRHGWAKHLDMTDDDAARALAPWHLDTFDALDAIAREGTTVRDDGILVVVDLGE